MERPSLIPLFPLDLVLLPGSDLPLHIFEPRYKSMIGRCLGGNLEFGVVFASHQRVAKVGCTAHIVRKTKDYSDGRMDILTQGRSVFRLIDILDQREYYEGIVEYIEEEPGVLDLEQELQLTRLFKACHHLLYGRPWSAAEPENPKALAYQMASRLPIESLLRQKLLEMRNEGERRGFLLGWMESLLPKLAERGLRQNRAGGNGHGLN